MKREREESAESRAGGEPADRTRPLRDLRRGRESSLERERRDGADGNGGIAAVRRAVQRGGRRPPGTESVVLATLCVFA
jgi:hypothetical protein